MKNSFRTLYVWETSVDLAVRIIELSDRLVARRRFAIADQLGRHYLVQARGSLYELETQLEIVTRARLAKDVSGVRKLIAHISAGLTKMIDRLADL